MLLFEKFLNNLNLISQRNLFRFSKLKEKKISMKYVIALVWFAPVRKSLYLIIGQF